MRPRVSLTVVNSRLLTISVSRPAQRLDAGSVDQGKAIQAADEYKVVQSAGDKVVDAR